MDSEFLLGEQGDLVLRVRKCPQCEADGAQFIEFANGRVIKCEACGLLELQREDAAAEGAPA